MDLQMPGIDGFEATRLIRELPGPNGAVPILAITASAEAGTRYECAARGMNGVITKPLRRRAILETIESWLLHSAGWLETPRQPSLGATAHPTPSPAQHAVLDYPRLIEQFGGKVALARSMAREFSDALPGEYGELSALNDGQAYEPLRRRAHRLKGGAKSIGATTIAELAARLETCASRSDASQAKRLLEELLLAQRSLATFVSTM